MSQSLKDSSKVYPTAKVTESTELIMEENTFIGDFCFINCKKLVMKKGSQINSHTRVIGRGSVYLGEDSVIGYNCSLITSSDLPSGQKMNDASPESLRNIKTGDITIEKDCFIGSHTIIMSDVKIGEKSCVGANSYIDEDILAGTIVIPNKSLLIKKRTL